MDNQNWWKIAVIIIAALALFGLGFYIGRQREPEVIVKTETEYIELPPIHDTIKKPVPYKVIEPVDSANIIFECVVSGKFAEMFPDLAKKDTLYITKEDTTAIMRDWLTKRLYAETLFDSDTLGKFKFDAEVQYNRLQNFEYDFTPVQKQTTVTTKTARTFLPYVGAGVKTNGSVIAQGGMFFHQDAGFGVQYDYNWEINQHSFGALFLYMF